MRKRLVVIALLVVLSGCASQLTSRFPVPGDPEKTATVYVYRTGDFAGSALRMSISVDGYVVAKLSTDRHVKMSLEPGQHSVGTTKASTSLQFDPGAEYYFQVDMNLNGAESFSRVEPA